MQSPKRYDPGRRIALAAACAAVAILASGTPAHAAGADYKGWFVALDLANTQPTGVDQSAANLVNSTTGFTTRQVIDNSADFTWAIKAGYSWGELGGLEVSYWSFDNDDTSNNVDNVNYVYPTVFGYGYNSGSYGLGFNYPGPSLPVTYTTTSSLKASIIDVDYFRAVDVGERFTIKWLAGLRSASYEEDLGFNGSDGAAYYIENKHIESDALGVKVGAVLSFGFSDRFALQGKMAFSFLQGDTQSERTINANGSLDQVQVDTDNVRGEIRDYDLRGVWMWENLDVYLGYGGQTWDGLVADPLGSGSCCSISTYQSSTRDSIGFNSLHAGIVFRFGGHG
jgi:hypothetical protein